MKRTGFLLTLLCTLMLGTALADDINFRRSLASHIFNPCTSTTDFAEGQIHVQGHAVIHDNNAHAQFHTNIHLQGDELIYKANQQLNLKLPFASGSARVLHSQLRFRVIDKGAEPNYTVYAFLHFTINANGELTVDVRDFQFECRG